MFINKELILTGVVFGKVRRGVHDHYASGPQRRLKALHHGDIFFDVFQDIDADDQIER